MTKWQVHYWINQESGNVPVKKWLNKLTIEQQRAIFKKLYLLEEHGNKLELPHSKALGKGLFELRDMEYGYRIYYGFHGKLIIIVLAAGDKTSQDKDIKTAYKRFSELK